MAPYLATATNGEFETRFGRILGGLREYNAVDPTTRRPTSPTAPPEPHSPGTASGRPRRRPCAFQRALRPLSVRRGGAIVDYAPNVFYHLESQTKRELPGRAGGVH